MTGETANPGQPYRILIVEDENIVALDMKFRLEGLGYQVCGIKATGPLAIEAALAEQPSLILMDIQLKGPMDGIDAAGRIHAQSDVPIVFVTAFTDDTTLERVKKAGAYGYIVKPYHERELRIAIELASSKYIYEKELTKAKELAEASDAAKTRFLSNISHELKTPLNSIIGFTDLATSVARGAELQEYLSLAARGARRLETLIDSVLDYTKIESGALSPVMDDFDLDLFVRSAWEPFAYDARSRGLDARLYVDPDLPASVRGDYRKMLTLVRNLIDNAVKFTESGYVLLAAERKVGNDGNPVMCLRIVDTGVGVSDEHRSKLFKLFTQGDDSVTRPAGGLGLGLSLSKSLADLMHLELEYTDRDGNGSEFSLKVPLPVKAQPAFQQHHFRDRNPTLAIVGDGWEMQDVEGWAGHLGFDVTRKPDGISGADVIVALADSWNAMAEPERAGALGGRPYRLVILGAAPCREMTTDEEGHRVLPYPASLGAFFEAVQSVITKSDAAVAGEHVDSGAKTVSVDASDPSAAVTPAPAVAARTTSTSTVGSQPGTRDYGALFASAKDEAEAAGLGAELATLAADMGRALLDEDRTLTERLAKKAHDRFADAGALRCARFALAVSMDARKGNVHYLATTLLDLAERRKNAENTRS